MTMSKRTFLNQYLPYYSWKNLRNVVQQSDNEASMQESE